MSKPQQNIKGDLHVLINKQKRTSSTDINKTKTSKPPITKKTKEQPRFICEYCEKQCRNPSTLKRHVVTHTGQKDFKCNLCDYSASRKSWLNDHIRRHVNEREFVCTETGCKAAFVHAAGLKSHQLVHNKNDESLQKWGCSQCTYKTIWKSHLTLHINTIHSSLRPFSCPHEHCEYSAKRKWYIKQHLKVHSSEKQIACPQLNCGFKTNRSSSLRDHKKTHSPDENKHKCNYCGYGCHNYYNLIQHTRTHTLETPFSCQICQFKSRYQGNLSRHMKTHLADRSNA